MVRTQASTCQGPEVGILAGGTETPQAAWPKSNNNREYSWVGFASSLENGGFGFEIEDILVPEIKMVQNKQKTSQVEELVEAREKE